MSKDDWIRLTVLKTHGIFCFIAASLNACMFPHSRCLEIFATFKALPTHDGAVTAGWALSKLESLVKDDNYKLITEKLYVTQQSSVQRMQYVGILSGDEYLIQNIEMLKSWITLNLKRIPRKQCN